MKMKTLKQLTTNDEGQRVVSVFQAAPDDKTLEIYLYDVIEGDQYNDWTGETIKSQTSADAIKQVLDAHPNVEQINLFVNSRGGSVIEAMGIRAHLLRHPANKTAYVDGWAASAASFVLTACDEIVMLTGSMQMLHAMWVVAIGNAVELRKVADDLDRMMAANRQIYLDRANGKLTEAKLIELMDAETWLNAEECVELGLADRVVRAQDYRIEFPERDDDVDELAQSQDVQVEIIKPPPSEAETEAAPIEGEQEETAPNAVPNFIAAMIKAAGKDLK